MFRGRYKILSSLIIFMFLFTLFPAQADAQEEVTVEKAISIVKAVFEVPDTYSKFTSGTISEGGKKLITLAWEDPANQNGHLEAQVNAVNGDIVSMYRWSQTDSAVTQLPTMTLDQAVGIAKDLLKKTAPGKAAYFRLYEDSQLVPLSGYGTTIYLRFMRYENNIPVENDTASVEVNMATGQINSYNMNWSDLALPAAQKIISQQQAGEAFGNAKILELQYLLRQNNPRQPKAPLLVYTLDHPSNGMIDAFTGEPVILQGGPYWYGGNAKEAAGGMGSADQAALTPEEISEIEKLADLMSQAEADKVIRDLTGIPAEAVIYSASVNQDYMDPALKVWHLNYRIDSVTQPAEFNASINAETGELLSYYAYNSNSRSDKADLSKEAAQKIAEAWLQKTQPNKISQVQLEVNKTDTMPGYEPGEWYFNYQRLVNGILCPGNAIYISIDRSTSKVTNYTLSWSKTTFPGAENVMGTDKANTAYLGHMPMTLTYITEYEKNNAAKFRLVYMPRPVPPAQSASMIDAVSGVKLDWEGSEMKDKTAVSYDDIDGHFAQEQIKLLAQSGIMTEYGSSFHPNEAVKLITVLRAMVLAHDGNYNQNLSDEEIMQIAINRNWITKNEAAGNTIDRARMAKLMVSFMRLDFVAKNGDMFVVPYDDAAKLPADLKGYAGLTRGLGIIRGSGNNFDPEHVITRGETAAILVRALAVKPVQVYW